MFHPVPPDADFVTLETEELARWSAHDVFARSVKQREGAEPWVFYEGPPTANGKPGLHHVWARIYKDLFCRFRAMRGYEVARRAGWDTHGLPVEVEVEKKLGITGKEQIESMVGIAEFTRLCRESVHSYVADFAELTTRIGYWVDLDAAYWTLSPEYVQSVWWHLKTLFDQDLLYEGLKVVPYCPRCGTALSSHELGQPGVYSDEEDESAYVLFPLDDAAGIGATSLAVWTTTPWTLLSNTGVAVNPDLSYVVVDGMVMAESLVDQVLGEGASARIVGASRAQTWWASNTAVRLMIWRHRLGLTGGGLSGPTSSPPKMAPASSTWRPAFGEIDRQVGFDNGLPTLNPVGADGAFTSDISWLAGMAVRQANTLINDRLAEAGLLLRRQPYVHSYPHCWRCGTPLIYWGKPSWYIATSSERPISWRPTRPSTGTPATSKRVASASGWPTTLTGPSRGTASGVRLCQSGAATRAICTAWAR